MWELICCTVFFASLVVYVIYVLRPTDTSQAASSTLDAFIRNDQVISELSKDKKKYQTRFSEDGRQILILYGTEYGFSEEIAYLLFDRLKCSSENSSEHWQPRVLNVKHHKHIHWELENVCFIVISTSGDGVPPADAREFMSFVMEEASDLSHLGYSVLALGDSSYPHFCRTGRMLDSRMKMVGGQVLITKMEVDGEDWSAVNNWIDAVVSWVLSSAASQLAGPPRRDYLDVSSIEKSDDDGFSRNRPFIATLKNKVLLTRVDNPLTDRETIKCEFDISGSNLRWTSGDALGIYPMNNPSTVTRILFLLHFTGDEMVQAPSHHFSQGTISLKEALLKCYDIKCVPDATYSSLRDLMAHPVHKNPNKMTDELEKEYLATRELIDVLEDLTSCSHSSPTIEQLSSSLHTLRPLQPRFYSIASSPLLDNSTVTVIAAVVRYTAGGRERGGVTTTFLQDHLAPGGQCPVFISHNPDFRLPVDRNVPVILIGAGTGLAPYRAFLQEQELANNFGKTFLYFGCRHNEWDYLCQQELEKWADKGILHLRVAFSRQQQFKVYVQDLLIEDSHQIWQLINEENATLYVCGDARNMARDVDAALTSIVEKCKKVYSQDAKEYMSNLQNAGRYLRDVWIT
ncbi:NADPH oxidoreductase A-like [Pomacea canaliculata]|uniref:NADPH oxidoreductase A-like n=1 Tax=Pomacea canaliculata TaxID=400727 RepID=UPI000D728F08|nr:NADPH oxidoreductase A-like [Pomacea canaliculata]